MNPNPKNHSIDASFDAPTAAEDALKAVPRAGLDMRQVSVAAKDFYSEGQAVALCTFVFIPTIGSLVVLGPLAADVVRALEADPLGGATGALGGALASIGISDNGISNYETAVKFGKFMIRARGAPDMIVDARVVLSAIGAAQS